MFYVANIVDFKDYVLHYVPWRWFTILIYWGMKCYIADDIDYACYRRSNREQFVLCSISLQMM